MSRATISRPTRSSSKVSSNGKSPKTFRSAVNYLDSLTNYERVLGPQYTSANFSLSRMSRILSALGNPHRSFKTAHIAGTKGKGSTATMLAEMLRGCGLKVGLYTSPHLLDIRERIVVDGDKISEALFSKAVWGVARVTSRAKVAEPTYFEVLTAAEVDSFFALTPAFLGGVDVG